MTSIAVTTTESEKVTLAQQLADKLQIPFIASPSSTEAQQYRYLLVYTSHYLGIQKTTDKKFAPFYIDFLSGKLAYRGQQAGLRKELIARAMGVKPIEQPKIVDATAGLGRDSFILATLGFDVILLERSPVIALLLEDALKRAQADKQTAPIINRMHLQQTDAILWLNDNKMQNYDVIYLDPMFPERKKSASVKKEMVILQDLLDNDQDAPALFEAALACAQKRVVVKRPRLAANIVERAPNFALEGKSSRFDIYLK